MKRQTRIITLLVIDSIFFLIEITVGTYGLWMFANARVHGALAGPGR
jgi:hypothetical protein